MCEAGNALDSGCDACVSVVCAADATCCEEAWDDVCVQQAGWLCGACGAEGCGDLPAGGECAGDFVIVCVDGEVAWHDCSSEGELCTWDAEKGQVGCAVD